MRRTPPAEFAPALRAARVAAGFTATAAAREAGVSVSYFRKLEAGVRCPSVSVLETIAAVLGADGATRTVLRAGAVADAGRDHPRRARRLENRRLADAP